MEMMNMFVSKSELQNLVYRQLDIFFTLSDKDKTGNLIGLIIGVVLLLAVRDIISFEIVSKLVILHQKKNKSTDLFFFYPSRFRLGM